LHLGWPFTGRLARTACFFMGTTKLHYAQSQKKSKDKIELKKVEKIFGHG